MVMVQHNLKIQGGLCFKNMEDISSSWGLLMSCIGLRVTAALYSTASVNFLDCVQCLPIPMGKTSYEVHVVVVVGLRIIKLLFPEKKNCEI